MGWALIGFAVGVVVGAWVVLAARRHRSGGELATTVGPLREALDRFDGHVRDLERVRAQAYGELTAQVRDLARGQSELRTETSRLVGALRSPNARGRWGEVQLRRVVELAGMVAHCDFVEQRTIDGTDGRLRPDLVVSLPGGRSVVVDAKTPLHGYLDAIECDDEPARQEALRGHARQVRMHVAHLASKAYWEQLSSTPEFVVLFVPGEAFFSAALEYDPELIERAARQRVILATPTTLIALLRSVAYGWQQERVAGNVEAVRSLGRELHGRLATLADHVTALGRALDRSVDAYNRTVGSLESRVLVSARRFSELGAGGGDDVEVVEPVATTTRPLTAPELVAEDGGTDADGDTGDRRWNRRVG